MDSRRLEFIRVLIDCHVLFGFVNFLFFSEGGIDRRPRILDEVGVSSTLYAPGVIQTRRTASAIASVMVAPMEKWLPAQSHRSPTFITIYMIMTSV